MKIGYGNTPSVVPAHCSTAANVAIKKIRIYLKHCFTVFLANCIVSNTSARPANKLNQ